MCALKGSGTFRQGREGYADAQGRQEGRRGCVRRKQSRFASFFYVSG